MTRALLAASVRGALAVSTSGFAPGPEQRTGEDQHAARLDRRRDAARTWGSALAISCASAHQPVVATPILRAASRISPGAQGRV